MYRDNIGGNHAYDIVYPFFPSRGISQAPTLGSIRKINRLSDSIDDIQWYEKAFEKLKMVSKIDDLDRLIAVSLKQEDEHFSLYSYIQTVSQETDQHLEKTGELEVS